MNAHGILLIVAIICEFFATFVRFVKPDPDISINLVALGLFFYFISMLAN